MLHSIIPCLAGLGLDARWYAFIDDPPLLEVTKSLSKDYRPASSQRFSDGARCRPPVLVSSIDECAARMVETIQNRSMAQRLGRCAHQTDFQRFLLPRLIDDRLEISGEQMKSQLAKKVA